MKRLSARVRAVWRVLWRSHQLETEMQEEMRFHVEMEAERLVREHGLDAQEAHRQAYVRFGGVEKFKEEGRDARGRQWLDAISLDTRLGVRMLVKHRGLTLIGGFAMARAIAIGATFFEMISQMLNAPLPFEDGERVVALEYASANDASATVAFFARAPEKFSLYIADATRYPARRPTSIAFSPTLVLKSNAPTNAPISI